MKILLLNLPYKKKVIRRYQCSFNAYNFLFPPLELLYISAVLKKNGINQIQLIDCIADDISLNNLSIKITDYSPDFIITLTGFEFFYDDINAIKFLKTKFPKIKFIVFGYYPSLFYKEIIEYANIDFITAGEPEYRIVAIIKNLYENNEFNDGIITPLNKEKKIDYFSLKRITNLDELPPPDYKIINLSKYSEPFISKPFATIYTTRGCAYNCAYCIHSYGHSYIAQSPDYVITQIKYLIDNFHIKSLRFMDDNFTTNQKRLSIICEKLIAENINNSLTWTCLSRIDCLDEELIDIMANAGCRRIYIGIETLDKSTNKIFNKEYQNLDMQKINKLLNYLQKKKIETFSFLLIDYDSYPRLKQKVDEFIKLDLDYISVCKLIIYPNTELFDKFQDKIEFSIIPYKNVFKDCEYEQTAVKIEKYAILKFYSKPKNLVKLFFRFFRYPLVSLNIIFSFCKYLIYTPNKKQDFI